MLRRDRQTLFRKARTRPSTIFALAPDTAGEVGIALGALKHSTKVGGREIVQRRHGEAAIRDRSDRHRCVG